MVNLATWALREQDERLVGAGTARRRRVRVSRADAGTGRVGQSTAGSKKARYTWSAAIPGQSLYPVTDTEVPNTVVFGQVVGIHIDDAVINNGLLDYGLMQPIGRLGYMDYVRVTEVFAMHRPDYP